MKRFLRDTKSCRNVFLNAAADNLRSLVSRRFKIVHFVISHFVLNSESNLFFFLFFKWANLFYRLFLVFFKQISLLFRNKYMWKMSIQCTVLGFKRMTFVTRVSPHNL